MIAYVRHKPKSFYPSVYLEIEPFVTRTALSRALFYLGCKSRERELLIYRKGQGVGLGSFTPSFILANKTFQVQERPL